MLVCCSNLLIDIRNLMCWSCHCGIGFWPIRARGRAGARHHDDTEDFPNSAAVYFMIVLVEIFDLMHAGDCPQ